MAMAARIPYDVWIDILGNVEETKDLAHCVVVNSLISQATLPVLYRTIRVKYVDLDGRAGVSMIHSNNAFVTLKARPHLSTHVKEIRFHVHNRLHNATYTVHGGAPVDVLSTLFNLTACTIWSPTDNIISTEVLHDIISNLRLCHHLTHLHWDFGVTARHMPILGRLRADTTLRLRSLTLGEASTEAIQSLDVILRSFAQLTSLRLQSTSGLDVTLSRHLVANGALSRLKALQIGFSHTLPAPALLSFVSAGSNLTELDVVYDYFLLGRDSNAPLPGDLGLLHLKSLVVRHQGVAGVDAFHELFSWISRLAARSPLQHLNIVSDDSKRHGCKGGACLATVARQHPTLVSLSTAHVYLGAAFISLVAKACPLLEVIECAPPKPPRVRRLTSGPSESDVDALRSALSARSSGFTIVNTRLTTPDNKSVACMKRRVLRALPDL